MREKIEDYPPVESYCFTPIPLPGKVLEVYKQDNIWKSKTEAYQKTVRETKATGEPLVNLSSLGVPNRSFEWQTFYQMETETANKLCIYLRQDVFVRKTVAENLARINRRLEKAGYRLYVRSGFRHPVVQEEMFLLAKKRMGKDFARSRLAIKEDLVGVDANYPHASGGVVDVEIWQDNKRIRMGEKEVPIGTFDLELLMSENPQHQKLKEKLIQKKLPSSFSGIPESWLEYSQNRRLLYHVMREGGFYFNFDEFWHWSMGDHLSGVASYLLGEADYQPWYGLADFPLA